MRAVAAALGAVVALVVAGCGGGSGSATVSRTATTGTPPATSADGGGGGATPAGFAQVYARESQGVVTVLAEDPNGGGGLGSGFVLDDQGEIATNAHVVTTGSGNSIQPARNVYVRFPDDNQVGARVVGFDPFSDVALLKVDPKGLSLRPLPLGDVSRVRVGEPVAAIGSPYGEENSLSVGVISATGRSIESLTGFQTVGALQTDAAINSGNSGGPLLDTHGRVLGINSQIRTTTGAGSGVGFAVPADVVRRSLDQLRRDGRVRYAYLGVSTQSVYPQAAQHFDLPVDHGAWIQEVVPGGPAARAGLRAGDTRARFQGTTWVVGGDLITKVDGRELRHDTDLSRLLLRHLPGDTVELQVYRGHAARTVRVKLGTRPLSSPQG